mmetsp:Transcript_15771/g.49037  ORF Transcript_15771/g.49037 Transcript_15771/m.49037 type:complete len:223 (-) Transcript_15771:675-1343(-)
MTPWGSSSPQGMAVRPRCRRMTGRRVQHQCRRGASQRQTRRPSRRPCRGARCVLRTLCDASGWWTSATALATFMAWAEDAGRQLSDRLRFLAHLTRARARQARQVARDRRAQGRRTRRRTPRPAPGEAVAAPRGAPPSSSSSRRPQTFRSTARLIKPRSSRCNRGAGCWPMCRITNSPRICSTATRGRTSSSRTRCAIASSSSKHTLQTTTRRAPKSAHTTV